LLVIRWTNGSLKASSFSVLHKTSRTVEHGQSSSELSRPIDLWGLLWNSSRICSTSSWDTARHGAPTLSQDTSCLFHTLVPSHHRSANRCSLVRVHLINLRRTLV